jgi:hypothetical protein
MRITKFLLAFATMLTIPFFSASAQQIAIIQNEAFAPEVRQQLEDAWAHRNGTSTFVCLYGSVTATMDSVKMTIDSLVSLDVADWRKCNGEVIGGIKLADTLATDIRISSIEIQHTLQRLYYVLTNSIPYWSLAGIYTKDAGSPYIVALIKIQ